MNRFKSYLIVIALLIFLAIVPSKANAAVGQLINIKDTITSARPSASAPLNVNQAANATYVTLEDNGSIYLASDSAIFTIDTGETQNVVNVASMSAQISGTPNTRILYLTEAVTNTHHEGDAVVVNSTAVHTVQFTTATAIPVGGKVIITFPGSGSNIASPSADTFSFNNLAEANVTFTGTGTNCETADLAVSAPSITCTTDTSVIAPGTAITATIGSSTPALINPTKSAAAGTADIWKLTIETQDDSSQLLDQGFAKIATPDQVQVHALVEPYITFAISGVANGQDIVTQVNTDCTSNTDDTNTGIGSTPVSVNLGILASSIINLSAQNLTISTNGTGYAITATSSGRFLNPATGEWITDANGGDGLTANDTPVPAVFTASDTPDFGIHACGTNAAAQWDTGATAFGSGAKYANPWNSGGNSYYMTIASYTGGPVSGEVTTVEYAATISNTTPAGLYRNNFTYVATATF